MKTCPRCRYYLWGPKWTGKTRASLWLRERPAHQGGASDLCCSYCAYRRGFILPSPLVLEEAVRQAARGVCAVASFDEARRKLEEAAQDDDDVSEA